MRRLRRPTRLATALLAGLLASSAPALAVSPTATSAPPGAQSHSDPCNPDDLVTVTAAGTIDPGGTDTTWSVQYGPTPAYGAQTTPQTATAANGAVDVTAALPAMTPGTLHYRLVASGAGMSTSTDQSVTTTLSSCPAPEVQAELVIGQADSSGPEPTYCLGGASADYFAVMTAGVTPAFTFSDPTLVAGSAAFEYGPTTAYGSVTPAITIPWQAGAPVPVSIRVDNLTQTVHYALVLTDPAGTQLVGPDTTQLFPTLACTAKLGTTTTRTIGWTLVHTRRGSRAIVIRYRPPCAVGRPTIRVVVARTRATITVGVVATYRVDGPCAKPPAHVTRTVNLGASLHHRHLVHRKTNATSF
jgi:hypothetical protein